MNDNGLIIIFAEITDDAGHKSLSPISIMIKIDNQVKGLTEDKAQANKKITKNLMAKIERISNKGLLTVLFSEEI